MRITSNMVSQNVVTELMNRYSDLSNDEEELATGKRLLKPSDDPTDVANDMRLTSNLAERNSCTTNINSGMGFMNAADTAMSGINTLMERVRELSVQASSDTLGATDRTYINTEVQQLYNQAISLVNTQYNGDYVFDGTQTTIPPLVVKNSTADTPQDHQDYQMDYFNANGQAVGSTVQIMSPGANPAPVTNIIPGSFSLSGPNGAGGTTTYVENTDYTVNYQNGTITILNPNLLVDLTPSYPYNANSNYAKFNMDFQNVEAGQDANGKTVTGNGQILREIEPGVTSPINISTSDLTTNIATGTTLIGTFEQFGQALVQNNTQGIGQSLTNIDNITSTILAAQAKNGARINLFQASLSNNNDQITNTTALQSSLEDADLATTTSQMALAQNVYQAALKAASMIIQPTLASFL